MARLEGALDRLELIGKLKARAQALLEEYREILAALRNLRKRHDS